MELLEQWLPKAKRDTLLGIKVLEQWYLPQLEIDNIAMILMERWTQKQGNLSHLHLK